MWATNGYKCECIDGFEGDNCEITPCDTAPCQNDGTCEVIVDGVGFGALAISECFCEFPFSGAQCQHSPCNDMMNGDPCENGGTCEVLVDGNFKCDCPTGKIGETCEETPCDEDPCNDGTCSVVGDSFSVSTCSFRQLIIN